MGKEFFIAIAATNIVEDQNLFATAFGRGKMEVERRIFRCQFNPFQAVQLGLAAPGLLGLDTGLILADIFFRFFNVFLLFIVGTF